MKITVFAKTGSKENKVEQITANEFKVWVNKIPEKGRANVAIINLLAKYFDKSKTSIELVTGQKSKKKIFEIQ